MKILLVNTHSTLNSGDTGIVLAQIKLLKSILPQVRLALTSRTPEIDRQFYAHLGIKVHPPFTPAPGVFTGRWQKCKGSVDNLMDFKAKRELLAEIKNSDLVISSGGGYFYSYSKYFPGPTFLQHFVHLKLALFWNKPVVYFPQSFGPFANSLAARLCKSILQNENVLKIFTREKISQRLLSELLKGPARQKVIFCPDTVFLLEPTTDRNVDDILSSLRRPLLALTLRDWHFPGAGKAAQKQAAREKYLNSMIEVSSSFLKRFGGTVVVVPQVRGPDVLENDATIFREFLKRSGEAAERNNILLFPANILNSPEAIIALFSRADLVLATRFHSAIFAMLAQTPVVTIGYQHKAAGMLRELGLERHLVDISDMSPGKILAMMDELIEKRATWREKIVQSVSVAREMIYASLADVLKGFQT